MTELEQLRADRDELRLKVSAFKTIILDACTALATDPEQVDTSGASEFQILIQAGV